MASYTKKIALNTVVQIVGKVITTAISVVTLAYLSRYLGVGGYGEYTIVFAFIGFFAIVADLGLYNIAIREVAKDRERSSYIMGNIATIRIFLAVVFLVIASLIGYFIPSYSEAVKIGLWIASLSSFFVLLNQLLVSIFQANLRMDKLVIGDVVGRVFLFALTILFIYMRLELNAFIFANVVCNLVVFLVSLVFSRKFLIFTPTLDIKYCRYIFKEALPLGVVMILGLLYFRIDSVILSLLKDKVDVGIYGAPYKILELLITIPAMFTGSVFPLISRYFHEGDPRLKTSFKKTFDFISIMAFPMLVGTFVLSKPIVLLVLGAEFYNSAVVLQYLIFAVFIIFFGSIMANFVIATNLQKKLVPVYAFSLVFNIVANLLLIPRYSYLGCAMVTIATEYIVCMSAYLILYKNIGLLPDMKIFFKAFLSSLVMGVVLYFAHVGIVISVIIGALVYITFLYLLKGINKEMVAMVLRK